jgi:hypothetical protein
MTVRYLLNLMDQERCFQQTGLEHPQISLNPPTSVLNGFSKAAWEQQVVSLTKPPVVGRLHKKYW